MMQFTCTSLLVSVWSWPGWNQWCDHQTCHHGNGVPPPPPVNVAGSSSGCGTADVWLVSSVPGPPAQAALESSTSQDCCWGPLRVSVSLIARGLTLSQARLLPLKVYVHAQYYDSCTHSIMSLVWYHPAGKVLCWCPRWASTRETLALSSLGAGSSTDSDQRRAWKGN